MDINNPYLFNSAQSPRNYLVIEPGQARPNKSSDQSKPTDNAQAQAQSSSVNAASTPRPNYTVTEAYKTLAEERAYSQSNKVSQVYTAVSHGDPGPNIIDTYA